MEITIKVPDELAAEAKARGLDIRNYVEELLSQRHTNDSSGGRKRAPEEIQAWLASLSQFSEKVPPLPENISREWIQDRD